MSFLPRVPKLVRLAIVVAAVGVLIGATRLERRRIERTAIAPSGAAGSARVDEAHLISDLETLSSEGFGGRLPGTDGSRRAQRFILERFRTLGLKPVNGSYEQKFSFTHHSIKGAVMPSRRFRNDFPDATNIMGVLVGTSEPERYTVVSAHYDHLGVRGGQLYPGADDNASGVAVMLAAATYFSRHPTARSLLFIAFDGEEEGLQGSGHFVSHAPVDMKQVALDINLDMVGRGLDNTPAGSPGTLYAAGTYQSPSLHDPIAAAAAGRNIRLLFGHDRPMYLAGGVESWVHSSDHGSFHDAGIPFIYFGVEDHPDVHKPTDTADRIPHPFFVEASNLIVDVIGIFSSPQR
jgi:hypothetical protein